MSARRSLLRNRPFVALCAARAVSATGDQIAAVALVLLIAKDHPATAVGGLLLAESLPMLLSTHAGVIADRFERRRLMIGCQLGQGALFAVVTVWLPPYPALLALLVLAARVNEQHVCRALAPIENQNRRRDLVGNGLESAEAEKVRRAQAEERDQDH